MGWNPPDSRLGMTTRGLVPRLLPCPADDGVQPPSLLPGTGTDLDGLEPLPLALAGVVGSLEL